MRNLLKSAKAKIAVLAVAIATVPSLVFADATTPTSMLDAQVNTIIGDFAADIVPTVLAVVAVVVPAGLTIWAIGFGIKKGLGFLQRRAKSAL